MAAPLLQVKGLYTSFGRGSGEVKAVKDVSFDVDKGETVALVGESGSGKSVSALSILQLLPYPMAWHPGGSIKFQGQELMGAKDAKLRTIRGDRIAMIFQEPLNSLNPLHTIERQINEVLFTHKKMSKKQARKRVEELLDLVGLPSAKDRLQGFPHEFSGGQQQRIMIAMALANDPDLLIADEPTTALDVTIQAQILKLLRDLQDELGMAVLMITHDLGIVEHVSDRVCVMTEGEVVEQGDTKKLYDKPKHPYTRKLLGAEPKGGPRPVPKGAKELLKSDDFKVWYPIKKGIIKRVVGHVKAVDGVDVTVREGETLGVVGESGSGKSTLAYGLLRLEESIGPIVFMGDDIQGKKFKELLPYRREMQMVFQDPFGSLSPRLSVYQIIAEGLEIHGIGKDYDARRERVAEAMEEVDLDPDTMDRYPHEFSGGQRQRISIARALVLKPKLIVLDEPTSALDMTIQVQIVDLLRRLQKDHNLAYMFISHDLKVVKAMAHKMIVLRDGKVVEAGTAKTIFDKPKKDYTKALMAAAFELKADTKGVVSK